MASLQQVRYLDTQAVILKSSVQAESDQLVTFMTRRYGKLKAVAKGGKRSMKRFMNCLDDFGLVYLSIAEKPGRDLGLIDSCHFIMRPDYTHNPLHFGLAGLAVELVFIFCPEGEPDPDTYLALTSFLIDLANQDEPMSPTLAFMIRLIHNAGFGPNVEACQTCATSIDEAKSFSLNVDQGGLICSKCLTGALKISIGAAKTIKAAQTMKPESLGRIRFPAKDHQRLFGLLGRYASHCAEREIRSLSFIKEVARGTLGSTSARLS